MAVGLDYSRVEVADPTNPNIKVYIYSKEWYY